MEKQVNKTNPCNLILFEKFRKIYWAGPKERFIILAWLENEIKWLINNSSWVDTFAMGADLYQHLLFVDKISFVYRQDYTTIIVSHSGNTG